MNVPVIFLAKGDLVHPGIKGTNLVKKYIFPEGYLVILNKSAYVCNETWEKVIKVVDPDIRKTKMKNVVCSLSIYLTPYLCIYKLYAD